MARRDDQLSHMIDEWRILQVINTYARGVDRCDADWIRSCYHPDAVEDHGVGYYVGDVEGFIELVVPLIQSFEIARHEINNFCVDVCGDRALTETYVTGITRGRVNGELVYFEAGTRFLDVFERRSGSWRIAKRKVVYDTVITVRAEEFVSPGLVGSNTAKDASLVEASRWRESMRSAGS